MKIKIKLLSCLFFFIAFLYLLIPPLTSRLNIENQISEDVIVSVSTVNGQLELELENYLIGVLASEMPASFELEALKAQAVASRSYVYSRELIVDDTTSSQVYQGYDVLKEKWQEAYDVNLAKIQEAVMSTKGQVLVYDQQIIHAYFFSSSNGKTNNSEDYWTTPYPYLVSVDSHYDDIKQDNKRTKAFTFEELSQLFGETFISMEIISHYESGYVKEVRVNEKIYSGREIREMCSLSSSSFQIEKNDQGIVFTTLGSGHGVGMSQYGAQGMALEGHNYIEILKHYYQGTEIVNK